jgi:hypothetical protein
MVMDVAKTTVAKLLFVGHRGDSYIWATWICQHYYVMAWSSRDFCFEGVLPLGTSAKAPHRVISRASPAHLFGRP